MQLVLTVLRSLKTFQRNDGIMIVEPAHVCIKLNMTILYYNTSSHNNTILYCSGTLYYTIIT